MKGTVDLSPLLPRFFERLKDRLCVLDAALNTVEDATEGELQVVMRHFHSLAGIGGTYGFPEVTRLASAGELLMTHALRENRHVVKGEVAAARLLVAELSSIRMQDAK